MKKSLLFLQLFFSYALLFSQATNQCVIPNAGFELGTTSGWILKSGGYGVAPCPTGSCPRYGTTYTGGGVVGAMNSPVSGAGNRHTIMSTAGGNDPNSVAPNLVPVVPPGGGTYSFRLGNDNVGSTAPQSQAEAIRLTIPVTTQNASFTYRYAFFVEDGSHTFESQPSFEVVVLDQNDNVIPCGRYFVVAGNYPSCVNSTGFITGNNGYVYKPWTDVGLDLTGYIGQNVSIEFRTTDCLPGGSSSGSSTSCGSTVCTLTSGTGATCTYASNSTPCTPPPNSTLCNGSSGTHSAYAYIDAYCSPLSVQSPVFCAGASSVQICAPVGYASYSWPAGQPGLSGSPTTQCVTVSNPVSGTTYTVNMVSATGCPTKTTVTLKGFDLTLRDTTICNTTASPFPLTLTPSVAGNYNYSWSPSAGLSCTTCQNPTYTPSATTKTYTVTMTDPVLGCSKSKTVTITISCGVNISATGGVVCPGACASVTSTASGGTPPYTYSWNPATGLSATNTANVTACPAATTTYTVTVNDSGGKTGSAVATVTVNSPPTITLSSGAVCPGACTTITAGGGTSYSWSAPFSGNASTQNACPAVTSTYTVTGTNANGCTSTATATVSIHPLPTVTVTNLTVCKDTVGTITASGASTYSWSCGGTDASIKPNTSVIGTTTCTVTGTDANGCINTAVSTIKVNDCSHPSVTVNSGSVCSGGCYNITAIGTGGVGNLTYSWNPNLGSGAGPFNVCPLTTSSYTVTVTDANGNTASDVATVTVDPAITLSSAPVNVSCYGLCNGQTIVIPSGGNGTFTYSWTGGCVSAACSNVCAGTYSVTVTDGVGCTATAVTTVTEPPALTVVNSSTNVSCFGLCNGTASVTASGGTPGYTYSWTPAGGAAANANNLCAGSYTCTITDLNNCTVQTSATITQPTQIIVNSANATICPGQTATLNASATGGTPGYTFNWSPSTTLSAPTGTTVVATPTVTTTYSIVATDANNCMGGTSVVVTAQPTPVISVPAATICEGTSTQLVASGANSYTWIPITGLSSGTGGTVIATPTVTTTYTIVGASSAGCTNSTSVTVTVNPKPILSSVGGNACPENPIALSVSGANSYSWSPSASLNCSTCANVIASPLITTTYTVIGTSANGCTALITATATVNPKPVALYNSSPIDANEFNPTIYFTDESYGGTITKWKWSFGDPNNSGSTLKDPSFTYPDTANKYLIKLVVVNQFGCKDSTTGTVYIKGIFTFYIPNTFTPNNDGVNDRFMPKGVGIDETDYDLWIFDRWGNLIWHTNIWGDSWDGRANGGANIAQIDTYVWKVHVKEKESGAKHNYIGHVNIVK